MHVRDKAHSFVFFKEVEERAERLDRIVLPTKQVYIVSSAAFHDFLKHVHLTLQHAESAPMNGVLAVYTEDVWESFKTLDFFVQEEVTFVDMDKDDAILAEILYQSYEQLVLLVCHYDYSMPHFFLFLRQYFTGWKSVLGCSWYFMSLEEKTGLYLIVDDPSGSVS